MSHEEDAIDSSDRFVGDEGSSVEEAPPVDIDGPIEIEGSDTQPTDPYDVDLPAGWSARSGDRTAVYESSGGAHRVRVVEFSRGLSLYWWVDVFVRDGAEWRRLEVGLGDSYTDPEEAAAAVESYLDRVDSETGFDGQ